MSKINLVGQIFGRLTVIKKDPVKYKSYQIKWECQCSCGNTSNVFTHGLTSGHTRSCGCLVKDTTAMRNMSHGMSKLPEYGTWNAIKGRCFNKNNRKWSIYGGRGIIVCERWVNSFENFLADMGKKPSKSHSIERKNNNGNYSPDNCKWATQKEQARNRRSNIILSFNGIELSVIEWAERTNIPASAIYQRIKRGWGVEKTLTEPSKSYR